jgi:hypothetical protein
MLFVEQCFKKPYKILMDCDITSRHVETLDWVNRNTKGNVQVKLLKVQLVGEKWAVSPVGFDRAFFAFDNKDDALVFRIKYGGNITSNR